MPQLESRVMLVFSRHGNAAPADPATAKRPGDLARTLTAVGRDQAERRRSRMIFGSVISSPASRAIETGEIVTGLDRSTFIIDSRLYTPDGPDGEALDHIFEEDSRRLPHEYFSHPRNQGAAERFVENASAAIREHLETLEGVHNVGVFGHGVYLNFAAMGLLSPEQHDHREQLGNMRLAEAGGFVMVLRNGVVNGMIPLVSVG